MSKRTWYAIHTPAGAALTYTRATDEALCWMRFLDDHPLSAMIVGYAMDSGYSVRECGA